MADPTLLITVYVFLIGLLLALGILLAFMPYLMRRQECFSVTVPAASANDPYLRKLKRRFATIMCALTAVLSSQSASFSISMPPSNGIRSIIFSSQAM